MLLAVVPLNHPAQAKSRLASTVVDRSALVLSLATHVLACLEGLQRIVVSPWDLREWAAERGAGFHQQVSPGLNPALEEVRALHSGELMVVLGDLPYLSRAEVASFVTRRADVVAAPDSAGQGTNLLLCRRPLRFHFGPDSCALHRRAAVSCGYSWEEFVSRGTGWDLDTPEQWEEYLCQAR